MQPVRVANIHSKTGVTQSGKNQGKPWELVIVTGDDGSEFTTFDLAIKEVGIGALIDIDVEIKNGKTNIKNFILKEKGTEKPAAGPTAGTPFNGGDSPVKRKSIEDQNRSERITELWIAGKIPDDDALVTKLRKWLEELGQPLAQSSTVANEAAALAESARVASARTNEEAFTQIGSNGTPELKNAGDLMTEANKRWGMTASSALGILGVKTGEEITDYKAAWATLEAEFNKAV